ncbi:MAG: hypothetical protein Q8Q09_06920 [Deltaproteobacteria bacterium]|nr:hypothetical protein [Deltaproteobacteria bacterium]
MRIAKPNVASVLAVDGIGYSSRTPPRASRKTSALSIAFCRAFHNRRMTPLIPPTPGDGSR